MINCIHVYQGVTGYNFQIKNVFLSMDVAFVLANSVDSDETHYFIMFYPVGLSTHFGVASIQKVILAFLGQNVFIN